MGESGKRRRAHPGDSDSKNHRRRSYMETDRDEMANDELVVYRILCPNDVIGSVIGKSGKVINAIRQDSRAKVKVVDPFPGAKDRVITIYCYCKEKEDVDIEKEFDNREPLCFAQDALLKVHEAIVNAVSMKGESDRRKNDKDREECRLLVPSSQSANIIGKSGATIKKLRNRTRTNIKITAKNTSDPADSCALEFDNFLLISGESDAVKKALFAVSAIMYKFTPKESIPLDTSVPESLPSIIIPSDIPMYPAAGLYPRLDAIAPTRSAPSILGAHHPSDIPSYADSRRTWPVYSDTLPMVPSGGGASQYEELIIKILCPSSRIGRVIGKGGSSIRNIRQDTGALVEVEDPKNRDGDCIVTLICTESLDDLKSMAVEAVLLLQGKINNDDDDTATMRLLVPSKIIGCIIGRSGSIINEIRKRTKAEIRISKSQKPKSADENDELVEISGQVGNLRDALVQIILRLRDDVLKKREDAPNTSADVERLYAGSSSLPVLRSLPPSDSLAYEARTHAASGLGLLSASGHGYGSLSMEDSGFGSLSSHSPLLYSRLPPSSTLEMVIPAHAIGKVMGKGGANIENIRKISGAAVEISESRSSRGDRVALISGTSEQKRAAENLVQAFIMAT